MRRFLISILFPVLSITSCAATEKSTVTPITETVPAADQPDTAALAIAENDSSSEHVAEGDTVDNGEDTAATDPGEFIETAKTLCAEGNFAGADSSLKKAIQVMETADEGNETEWFPSSRYVDEIVSIYTEKMPSGFQIPDDIAASAFQQQMARSLDSMKLLPPESFSASVIGCRNDLVYDVPMTWNERVQRALFYYVNNRRNTVDRWFLRAPRYLPFMRKTFADSGLPQDLAYLPLIESGFNPKAYSYAHAAGIWQFITSTARRYGLRHTYWLDERRDPLRSTQAAASYLKKLYGDFGHWHLALAAYNCGENGMNRVINRSQNNDFWKMNRLPAQTRNYVPSYLAALTIAKNPGCFGIAEAFTDTFPCDTVFVNECISLEDVSRAVDVPYDTLKKINPHLMRWCTPPDVADAVLYLPCGTKERFAAFVSQLPETKKVRWCRYEVKANDNLSLIARRFRIPADGVKAINRLTKDRLAAGQHLFLPLPKGDEKTAAYYIPPELPKEDDYGYVTRYRVRKGDCISTIARRFHVTCAQLYRWNRLTSKSKLRIGRRLIVRPGPPPEPVVVAPLTNAGTKKTDGTYVVQLGDTPFSIARRSGIAITDLLAWNRLDATRPIIHIGDRLILAAPEKKAGATAGSADTMPAADAYSSMWEQDTAWSDDWASAFTETKEKDSVPRVPSVNDSAAADTLRQ
ncbi:MAG: LysM peptidoglycan-binding domain-containing protein [Chitinispirillaceae bacterium]|nr:LysM peptidoglycan-binding domain-containing protein [Chitinispirillaceae bacterium]